MAALRYRGIRPFSFLQSAPDAARLPIIPVRTTQLVAELMRGAPNSPVRATQVCAELIIVRAKRRPCAKSLPLTR